MLRTTPRRIMLSKILFTAIAEGHRTGICSPKGGMLGPLVFYRVNPIQPKLSRLSGPLACLRQGQRVRRTDPHISQPPADNVTKNPLPAAARCDPQIERAAIGVHARLLGSRHPESGQSIKCPSHC